MSDPPLFPTESAFGTPPRQCPSEGKGAEHDKTEEEGGGGHMEGQACERFRLCSGLERGVRVLAGYGINPPPKLREGERPSFPPPPPEKTGGGKGEGGGERPHPNRV